MSLPINRRSLLCGIGALALTNSAQARQPRPGIAVTVDDFDLSDDPLMSGPQRDAAIRQALAAHGIKAAGFIAGRYLKPGAPFDVRKAWSDDGHILGNHTFSHRYYSGADPEAYMADILKCEALLSPYPGFRKIFRYPFLGEGKTAEGRDALRALLKDAGYSIGHVTIDTSDWFYASRLTARLKADPKTDLTPWRKAYLDHLWDRAAFYDGLAREAFGHSLDHTLLLHHNVAAGLFLGDALAMFKAKGWRLSDAGTAFAQPEFSHAFATLPSGQSLVWAAAKADGRFEARLRYPAEDGPYEAPKLDALGL
jgi:peptidoglycan-N-acetylglucosamine deacetylase